MVKFNVPAKNEVNIENKEIFDNLEKALGFVPNLYATMAYSDHALSTYLQFQNAKTSLTKKEKEAINLVVSQSNGCRYCQSAHTVIGKMNGFSEEETLEIRGGSLSSDKKLDALIKVTKEITVYKGRPNAETLESFFAEGYTKASLIDVVMVIADKVVMNYIHNITRVPIDFPVAQELALQD